MKIEDIKNTVICGDCATVMAEWPEGCIDLTITSPPYDDLRDYKGYVFNFYAIAKELYRVTKQGGVVVWVVGDATIAGSESGTSFKQALYFKEIDFLLHDTMIYGKNGASFPARKDSTRYSQIFEFMFIFSKGNPKTATLLCDKKNRWAGYTSFGKSKMRGKDGELVERDMQPVPEFSPRDNIWRYNTGKGYTTKDEIAYEHPAIFPDALARDHILTWSKKGDIVLDPMCGSGTTLVMAKHLERNYIGIDISPAYVELSKKRIGQYFL